MAEQVLATADSPTSLFEEVHDSQVGDRIYPKQPGGILIEHALVGRETPVDFRKQPLEHSQRLVQIRTKMDRQHLGNEHLQRRHGTFLGRVTSVADRAKQSADVVRTLDACRKSRIIERLPRVLFEQIAKSVHLKDNPVELRAGNLSTANVPMGAK